MERFLLLISLATSTALVVINCLAFRIIRIWREAAFQWKGAAETWEHNAALWRRVAEGYSGRIIDEPATEYREETKH
jgi:hypothetical protein